MASATPQAQAQRPQDFLIRLLPSLPPVTVQATTTHLSPTGERFISSPDGTWALRVVKSIFENPALGREVVLAEVRVWRSDGCLYPLHPPEVLAVKIEAMSGVLAMQQRLASGGHGDNSLLNISMLAYASGGSEGGNFGRASSGGSSGSSGLCPLFSGAWHDGTHLYTLMERLPLDLHEVRGAWPGGCVPEPIVRTLIAHALSALQALHTRFEAGHMDISPENLLLHGGPWLASVAPRHPSVTGAADDARKYGGVSALSPRGAGTGVGPAGAAGDGVASSAPKFPVALVDFGSVAFMSRPPHSQEEEEEGDEDAMTTPAPAPVSPAAAAGAVGLEAVLGPDWPPPAGVGGWAACPPPPAPDGVYGKRRYADPVYVHRRPFFPVASDLYSIGIVMWTLLFGSELYVEPQLAEPVFAALLATQALLPSPSSEGEGDGDIASVRRFQSGPFFAAPTPGLLPPPPAPVPPLAPVTPFQVMTQHGNLARAAVGLPPVSQEAVDLLERWLLRLNPSARPASAAETHRHPWFRGEWTPPAGAWRRLAPSAGYSFVWEPAPAAAAVPPTPVAAAAAAAGVPVVARQVTFPPPQPPPA